MIIGTFGRAAYILDDIRPFRELVRSKAKVLEEDFKAFPSPDAYLASYASVDGMRFDADASFRGQNRRRGALLTLWVKEKEKGGDEKKLSKKEKKEKEKEEEEKKEDAKEETGEDKKSKKPAKGKVRVRVFDMQGDTLYTFYQKLKPGMNRLSWNLRRKGVRFPSWTAPKPQANDPWGPRVAPGKYRLQFEYADYLDSTEVQVHADPRRPYNAPAQIAKDAALDDFSNLVQRATDGFNRLKDAKKTIALVDQQMVNVADSTQEKIKKLGLTMKDSIQSLLDIYTQPKGDKGIDHISPKLNRSLWMASNYLQSAEGGPEQNAGYAVAQARREVEEVLEKIDRFFAGGWVEYRLRVEEVPMGLFKKSSKN